MTNKNNQKQERASNIHIFVWPFKIENEVNSTKSTHETVKSFLDKINEKGWKDVSLDPYDNKDKDKSTVINQYARYQYLNESARDIFIHNSSKICSIKTYPLSKESKYQYYIKKDADEYYLDIVDIEIHIYEHGVGIIFINTKNDKYFELDDIRKINDYGRRFSIPFIPENDPDKIICADRIGIIISKEDKYSCTFSEFWGNVYDFLLDKKGLPENENTFLFDVLNKKIDNDNGVNEIKIYPYSDDRMFVMTLIRDEIISNKIKGKIFDQDDLYSLIYIDTYKDGTCHNEEMKKELIDKCLYKRWEGWGTLYGCTYYSFICITTSSDEVNSTVINPFVNEYKYLVSLVLSQRIGLEQFSERAGRIAEKKKFRKVISLQKHYITFKNQILLPQASSQQQGIELYNLMSQQFMIKEETDLLDAQLHDLFEIIDMDNGRKLQRISILIAIAAIVSSIIITLILNSWWPFNE